ncbi:glycosyltransferase family 8 protein [Neisseria zalophi]|uniref:Glycosyltransferase family 8 protein n=1 Tax=Neisseria zalophi TaxID=640030 RepID=A0A5J6PXN9_9NEIS|nr:glycosyltransferase family 8 protein [Neisseria zalophi]QEY27034.1 glycosyltransferase family 8 protein [Neisseria zalophi]
MNIIFASDNNYAPYLATTLLSVLNNHKGYPIKFYILDLGINPLNREIISSLVDKTLNQIEFIPVSEDDFRNMPKTIDYISLATYARLKLTQYLPNIGRAIYLDIDILVNNSLIPLWETKLEDKWMGACLDAFIEYERPEYKYKIGLTDNQIYFNAGVLLIDLKKWRTTDIYLDAINWLKQYGEIIHYQDQDILNGLLKDKVLYLNTRYNFMPSQRARYIKYKKHHNILLSNLEMPTMPIAICHYCGHDKAWHANCTHTNAYLYRQIFKQITAAPASWQSLFEHIKLNQKVKLLKNSLRDKYKYKIY